MVSGSEMLFENAVPVAVSVSVELPVFAVELPVNVSVVEDPAVRVAGENCAVTPLDNPVRFRFSADGKVPLVTAQVIFVVAVFPTAILSVVAEDARVQTGGVATVSVVVTSREKPVVVFAPSVRE